MYALLLLLGLVQTLATCSPSTEKTRGWLQVLSMSILVTVLEKANGNRTRYNKEKREIKSSARALKYAFAFTLSWLCSQFWWIYISLHTYGKLPSAVAIISVLLLGGGLALYYVCACWAYLRACESLPIGLRSVLFGALWTLAELARAQWFTGFPWGAIGYAHLDNALKLTAPYVGVYGVGFFAATISVCYAHVWLWSAKRIGSLSPAYAHVDKPLGIKIVQEAVHVKRRRYFAFGERVHACKGLGILALTVLLLLSEPWVHAVENIKARGLRFTNPLTYALMQGNVDIEVKFSEQGLAALDWYKQRIFESKAQLIITPETALPYLKDDLPKGYWDELNIHFAGEEHRDQALLIGMIEQIDAPKSAQITSLLGEKGYFNSAVGVDKRGAQFAYRKQHLVPFGEFIPPWFKWFTDQLKIPLTSFSRGPLPQPSWHIGENKVSVNICYEDVFGEELAAAFDSPADGAPTIMVNMSNIAWFGGHWAVEQHLNESKMRAIEMQRPMLRATNTGATAAIDHNGYVLAQMPKSVAGVLEGSVRGVIGEATFYAWWSGSYSLYPLWLTMLGVYALIFTYARKSKRQK